MPVVTVRQESSQQRHFYVPAFEVRIAGAGLPRDVLRDVTQLTYTDSIKEIDGFELTVNNWDAQTRDFKYVGAETAAQLEDSGEQSQRFRLFQPCGKEVEVLMGYGGYLRTMLRGNFTTMEPNFPSGGAPTLTVRGLNVLHTLRRKQYTTGWTNRTDSQIAENIATLTDPDTRRRRFPLPIRAHGRDEEPRNMVTQNNQYDIDFLFTLARRRGYVVFIQEADRRLRRRQQLYFGPSQEGQVPGIRDVTFELEWGKSLIDFKPTLTTANQVRSVRVNGWNRRSRRPISEQVTVDDARLNVNRDLRRVLGSCDPREEVVVDEPVFTPAQARARALAILMDRQKEMVKASVTTVGLPDLRAGQTVRIVGLGARFSGTYFITETTHTINDGGYITKFNARRENRDTGGGAPAGGTAAAAAPAAAGGVSP